jgi:hypothetical protein
MRFTWDKETRTVSAGAALALTCGLMLGGFMRPDLAGDDRPAGPQQISGWAGVRSTGPFDADHTPALASYSGPVPDYVLGTDWKRSMAAPSEPAAISPPAPQRVAYEAADDEAAAPASRDGGWDPEARPVAYHATSPRAYPSEGGGTQLDPPPDEPPSPTG